MRGSSKKRVSARRSSEGVGKIDLRYNKPEKTIYLHFKNIDIDYPKTGRRLSGKM